LIGDPLQSNDLLELYTGVTLKDGPFPETFDKASDFFGVFHYRNLRPCSQALMETKVDLEFAINEDPLAPIMEALSDAVEGAISALAVLSPNLIRLVKFHNLELESVTSNFQGRSGKSRKQTSWSVCLSFLYLLLTFSDATHNHTH
jgi:hypothetical protein